MFLLERLQSANSNILWRSAVAILLVSETAFMFVVALKCDLDEPWIQYGVQCTGLVCITLPNN